MSSFSVSSVESIISMATLVMSVLVRALILGACIVGAMYPSLRREFIWLGLSSLLSLAANGFFALRSLLMIAAPDLHWLNNAEDIRLISQITAAANIFSGVLAAVGFVLLAVKARSLPVLHR